jgi:hypothetical protein
MRLRELLVSVGLALVLTNDLAPGYAAEAHMYRCVDVDGRVYYSDHRGVECEGGKHDSMTRYGIILDRPDDDSDALPGESIEERRLRQAEQRYDRALRATYTSTEQIEAAKQRSLQTPMLAVKWGRKKLDIYVERLMELKQREATLADSNNPIPDSLKEDIVTAESDVARLERDLSVKQREVDRIVSRYEADKERFRRINDPRSRRQ